MATNNRTSGKKRTATAATAHSRNSKRAGRGKGPSAKNNDSSNFSNKPSNASPAVRNYVDKTARLGSNVRVWHFAYVGPNTTIGDNVKIGSLAHVDYNVRIGNNVKIEGCAYIPPLTVIGNDVFIGPGVTFTNDPYPESPKMVGTTVQDGAIIAARAVIRPGLTIGSNSVVAMGSVVTRDVPAGMVVMGVPARVVYSREEYDRKKAEWESSALPQQQ
ncbi:MAG: N-acetyltransferase [Nitrososphaera sp.]